MALAHLLRDVVDRGDELLHRARLLVAHGPHRELAPPLGAVAAVRAQLAHERQARLDGLGDRVRLALVRPLAREATLLDEVIGPDDVLLGEARDVAVRPVHVEDLARGVGHDQPFAHDAHGLGVRGHLALQLAVAKMIVVDAVKGNG